MESARLQPRAAPSAGAPTLPRFEYHSRDKGNERARSALAATISEEPDIAVARNQRDHQACDCRFLARDIQMGFITAVL